MVEHSSMSVCIVSRHSLETTVLSCSRLDMHKEELLIDSEVHCHIIGNRGRNLLKLMDMFKVDICFPRSSDPNPDLVVIQGAEDDVLEAKNHLLQLEEKYLLRNFELTVEVDPQYHSKIIGRNGAVISKIRKDHNVQTKFPERDSANDRVITIIGHEKDAEAAKEAILKLVEEQLLRNFELTVEVDPQYHSKIIGRNGAVISKIRKDHNVQTKFPERDSANDRVITIIGHEKDAEAAKEAILKLVEEQLLRNFELTVEVDPQYHSKIIGRNGAVISKIRKDHNVQTKFPERDSANDRVITIIGHEKDAEAAKEAILKLVQEQDNVQIIEEMEVPYNLHRLIIGHKGTEVKNMKELYDVMIFIPPIEEKSDVITIKGPPENVAKVKEALKEKIEEIQDNLSRSFRVTVEVDPQYHPKIIGYNGTVISKIRNNHNVKIRFPKRDSANDRVITIYGYKNDAEAAKEAILKLIQEREKLYKEHVYIDSRVHSSIIGNGSHNLLKIMNLFKVDIRFPRPSDPDPDLVVIQGSEDDVLAAKDYILNLELKYTKIKNSEYFFK
ncbi:unnamed protein product [Larinioides sclopetarius]|uniref:K Homology domain-containing protein n=1 Tax=Larinioides sclopetarius TaxID=280406 RepID=A0AAV2ATE0_9ARAC